MGFLVSVYSGIRHRFSSQFRGEGSIDITTMLSRGLTRMSLPDVGGRVARFAQIVLVGSRCH